MAYAKRTPPGFDGLSRRAINRLVNAGIRSRAELRCAGDERLLAIRGFGVKLLAEVDAIMTDRHRIATRLTRREKRRLSLAATSDGIAATSDDAEPRRQRAHRSPRTAAILRTILEHTQATDALPKGWGTRLARQHGVSRQYVYHLISVVQRQRTDSTGEEAIKFVTALDRERRSPSR